MAMNNADLHIHSTFSDGALTVEDIFGQAKKLGIRCLSITDHDTLDHIPSSIFQSKKFGLEFLPGVEMTSSLDGTDVHLLAYGMDVTDSELIEKIRFIKNSRDRRIQKILDKLEEKGIDVDDFDRFAGDGTRTRLHVSDFLCHIGAAKNSKDAFDTYLGRGGCAYVGTESLSPESVIRLIRHSKGVPVLAHPGVTNIDSRIPQFVEWGLEGIEVFHSSHDSDQIRAYMNIAETYNLKITGGSDCHGRPDPNRLLGRFNIDYTYVERLKQSFLN